MAFATHPDENQIIKVPGYLFHAPTSFASEAGWGTKLGFCVGGIQFAPGHVFLPVSVEEDGVATSKIIFGGAQPTVIAVLKSFNSTILARLFPGMTSGTACTIPGSIKAGTEISSATYSKGLAFIPMDTTNHPIVYLPKACPGIKQAAIIRLSHRDPTTYPVVFHGLAVAGRSAYFGPLSGAVI